MLVRSTWRATRTKTYAYAITTGRYDMYDNGLARTTNTLVMVLVLTAVLLVLVLVLLVMLVPD